jgi:hypothetical protein
MQSFQRLVSLPSCSLQVRLASGKPILCGFNPAERPCARGQPACVVRSCASMAHCCWVSVRLRHRCQVVAPCCGNVYPCKKCHDAEEDHVLESQKVEHMVCMACNLQQTPAGECDSYISSPHGVDLSLPHLTCMTPLHLSTCSHNCLRHDRHPQAEMGIPSDLASIQPRRNLLH